MTPHEHRKPLLTVRQVAQITQVTIGLSETGFAPGSSRARWSAASTACARRTSRRSCSRGYAIAAFPGRYSPRGLYSVCVVAGQYVKGYESKHVICRHRRI